MRNSTTPEFLALRIVDVKTCFLLRCTKPDVDIVDPSAGKRNQLKTEVEVKIYS